MNAFGSERDGSRAGAQMKDRQHETRSIDELDLAIETLKDLTPSARRADAVRGGASTGGKQCYCGTM